MSKPSGKILAVNGVSNGNGSVPHMSDPNDFPIPLEGVITVELDTGRVVEMVIGELSMLYEIGEVPMELTPFAARVLTTPAADNPAEREKRYRERLRVAKWLVGRVTLGRIDVERLYHDEVWQIYNLANTPALALDTFRRYQARHVGTVSERQDMGTGAEPTDVRTAA